MNEYIFESPIGRLIIGEENNQIIKVEKNAETVVEGVKTPLIEEAISQLNEYFRGERKTFDLPLAPEGTSYQKQVWEKLREVPFGEIVTYKELAEMTDSPKSYRAVGSALGKNPLLIITPCHRVNNSDKKKNHFSAGVEAKAWLQKLEK